MINEIVKKDPMYKIRNTQFAYILVILVSIHIIVSMASL
jgi:hypothetical protein